MENERINRIVAEETSEMVIVFDEQGNILYGNRSVRDKLDYNEEDFREHNLVHVFWKEFQQDGAFFPFDINKIIDKKETAMYRKNSACFPVSLRIFPLEEGQYCLLAEDITWRTKMEMRLRNLKEEAELNRQMRNEFTANVTHELRTPVNGIKGHANNLLEIVEDEEQRRTLEIIIYCCDNMSSIINNILDFSKLEAGKFLLDETEFNFYKMMDQAIATHVPVINKKELQLSVYIDEKIPRMLVGDSLRIGQILNNLISNAVKFTLVGQISVDVSMTMQVNDEVELFFMVRDTGIGISKQEQDKLFQSFKQVDATITRRFGGTGLGLSITKQLVEMMNGTIHVESTKGQGSCFSFNIKLHTSQNEEENSELNETYKKWINFSVDKERDNEHSAELSAEDYKAELKKRMEKLVLSIELGSWEKAETLGETVKALTERLNLDIKKDILRLEMAVRKENYEKSMTAYEHVKELIEEKLD